MVEQPVQLGVAGGHTGDVVDGDPVHPGSGQGIELQLGVLGGGRDAGVAKAIAHPSGVPLSEGRRAGLVTVVTEPVLAAAGLGADQALRGWVLIHERADGTWGAGGQTFRYAGLVALAKGSAGAGA